MKGTEDKGHNGEMGSQTPLVRMKGKDNTTALHVTRYMDNWSYSFSLRRNCHWVYRGSIHGNADLILTL